MDFDMPVSHILEHHGVKGQRWGVIKKEDTHASARSRSEIRQVKRNAKAKKFTDKADDLQTQIDAVKNRVGKTVFQRDLDRRKFRKLSEKKAQALKDAKAKEEGHLTDKEKKIAIGAGAVATLAAAYGSYQFVQSGGATRAINKGRLLTKGNTPLWKVNQNLSNPGYSAEHIFENVVHPINADYGQIGTKVNCRRCTFAYELRRRGYDVKATKTTTGRGQEITGIYNAINPGINNVPAGREGIITRVIGERIQQKRGKGDSPFSRAVLSPLARGGQEDVVSETGRSVAADIFHAISKKPDGARGELGVQWFGGGRHSVAWEMIGGKPVIFDTQSGQMFKSVSELEAAYGPGSIAAAAITRLDDIPLNKDFLQKWVTNA